MLSSDLRIRKNFLKYLLNHFENPNVGMVVGRPIADKNSNIYRFSRIIWELHHILCLKNPKGTEICAFRKIFKNFPRVVADEVFIEYKIKKAGYRIIYEPRAYGFTKVPNSLKQLFNQRKRIFDGHMQIKRKYGFETSSQKFSLLLKVILEFIKKEKISLNLILLMLIETLARTLGFIESLFNYYEIIW